MSEDIASARHVRPGGSAQRMYNDERKAWIKRNRQVFRVVDGATALIVVATLVVWRLWPFAGWYAGLLAGAALCFDLAARMNPPTWIEQWQTGAYGEQRTGRELDKLPPGWLVLHDLARGNGTNVDHVVVGPPGVFLLDTKNVGTEVRIEGDDLIALRPDGRQRYRTSAPASCARGAAAALSRALTKADAGCWVHAVVVVWGDMPQVHAETRSLDWVSGASLADWLAGLPADTRAERPARARAALIDGRISLH